MAKVEFEPSKAAIHKILNSKDVIGTVDSKASNILARAKSMHRCSEYGMKPAEPGYGSAHAVVFTASRYAMRSNAKHNTLSKALRSVK